MWAAAGAALVLLAGVVSVTQGTSAVSGVSATQITLDIALPPPRDIAAKSYGVSRRATPPPAHNSAALEQVRASGVKAPRAAVVASVASEAETAIPLAPRHTLKIARGDSLYTIFKARNLPQSNLLRLLAASKDARQLARLVPGQELRIFVDAQGTVARLIYQIDETRALHLTRQPGGYASELMIEPLERREAAAAGVVESSLFLAGQRAGLSDKVIMKMAEILGWDVDFALDIRPGDHFSVVYEQQFKAGDKVRDGAILAIEFVNAGRNIRAVRYVDPSDRVDYYTPTGLNMRKAFLRTPVKFSRISSRFNLRRRHPVLHKLRAHRGVDYAAARGTPVRATGDGKIARARRHGGYGKTVIVKHGATYTTLYGHLSRYARGVRAGRQVRQGQIIGYVGSTGLATGPHLHYEFRVRGVHRDPLRVKLPKAAPIASKYKGDFLEQTKALVAQLDVLADTALALK